MTRNLEVLKWSFAGRPFRPFHFSLFLANIVITLMFLGGDLIDIPLDVHVSPWDNLIGLMALSGAALILVSWLMRKGFDSAVEKWSLYLSFGTWTSCFTLFALEQEFHSLGLWLSGCFIVIALGLYLARLGMDDGEERG